MKTVQLPCGERVPAFGLGTWQMAENARTREEELAALHLGFDLGATLIDTAEMYGEGRAEEMVSEAIVGRRDEVFIVTKVYPHNASRAGTPKACERSLRRLRTDRIDLYLLHWRGAVPLAETLEAFAKLKQQGKIRHYGVSNLDVSDMQEAWGAAHGADVQVNQVLYNLARRGIEWGLLPWLRERRVPVMAYSPLDEGRLLRHRKLADFARQSSLTAAQVALGWLLDREDVIVIPKTGHRERLKENLRALERPLTREQLAELDRLFPPPDGPRSLEMP